MVASLPSLTPLQPTSPPTTPPHLLSTSPHPSPPSLTPFHLTPSLPSAALPHRLHGSLSTQPYPSPTHLTPYHPTSPPLHLASPPFHPTSPPLSPPQPYHTDYMVADSAGSATAYLCGVKTKMSVVGMNEYADTSDCENAARDSLDSILTVAKKQGRWGGAGSRRGLYLLLQQY